ncbi:MAG: hypothetical protein L6277_11655 [Desulfobacterales bacterium]|nr:hypothetical protein [Pseudomonadota bacterium]MCG2772728.1 hypothetical protein [Desulfobacterales bacterium]
MVIEKGAKVHIITRRIFETDLRRHFVGEVKSATENVIFVEGYAFIFDTRIHAFEKRPELRQRIFSLINNGNIIFVLPPTADLEKMTYHITEEHRLVITDGSCSLDINEFGAQR